MLLDDAQLDGAPLVLGKRGHGVVQRGHEVGDPGELRSAVQGALAELGPQQREAVRLRVVDELGYPAVAARLGVSEQTARARVSRGLRALAQRLPKSPAMMEDAA